MKKFCFYQKMQKFPIFISLCLLKKLFRDLEISEIKNLYYRKLKFGQLKEKMNKSLIY